MSPILQSFASADAWVYVGGGRLEEAVRLLGPGPELLSKVNAGSQGRGGKEGSDTQ